MAKKNTSTDDMELGLFKTGFPMFDLLVGRDHVVDKENPDEFVKIRGLRSGSMVSCFAKSTYGKTTLLLNKAGNIIRKYKYDANPQLHIVDAEGGAELARVCATTGIPYDKNVNQRIKVYPRHKVTTEKMYDWFLDLYEEKRKNKDKYTGEVVLGNGRTAERYLPTIWFIDSISSLIPEKLKDKNQVDEMYAATKARVNNNYIEKMRDKASEVNIMIFLIQHEGNTINTSFYAPRENRGYSSDIKPKGGTKAIFESDVSIWISRIVAHNKKKTNKKYSNEKGFTSIMEATIVKNRYGEANNRTKYSLVQHREYGFDPLHSYLFDVLEKTDVIQTKRGSGWRSLEGYDDKFYESDILKLIETDADFRVALSKEVSKAFHDTIRYQDTDDILKNAQNLIDDLL